MTEPNYEVRPASATEVPRLLEIASAAQNKLSRAGSAQQIAGYTWGNAQSRVSRGELYLLEVSGQIVGSAFVEPASFERFPQTILWNAVPPGCSAWFLYGLIIDSVYQGSGLGRVLLEGICRQDTFTPPAILLLDCWAGNHKLRQFYSKAGFDLCGEFPEEDYQIAVSRRRLDEAGTARFNARS